MPSTASKKKSAPAKPTTVAAYFAQLTPEQKKVLTQVRKFIKAELPGSATEEISYNTPSFKFKGDGVLWFAAWKSHVSIYPASAEMITAITELGEYAGDKGTIKFSLGKPLPESLIRKIVRFRQKELKDKKTVSE